MFFKQRNGSPNRTRWWFHFVCKCSLEIWGRLTHFEKHTLPESNIAPERWWFETVFLLGRLIFRGLLLMEEILHLTVYPIIFRVYAFQVVQDFHQQYVSLGKVFFRWGVIQASTRESLKPLDMKIISLSSCASSGRLSKWRAQWTRWIKQLRFRYAPPEQHTNMQEYVKNSSRNNGHIW